MKLYKVTVHPGKAQAQETRAETSRSRKMLKTNKMKVPRKMFGKEKANKIRNQQIREICGSQLIKGWMELTRK